MKSLIQSLKLIADNLFPKKKTVTKIVLTCQGNSLKVELQFKPKFNPKDITFDQAAAVEGVKAIREFLDEHAKSQDPSSN